MKRNIELEEMSLTKVKRFVSSTSKINAKKSYGIKRSAKIYQDKIQESINKNGFCFPFVVGKTKSGDYWLLDGYQRFELENPAPVSGPGVRKFLCLVIEAKDEDDAKELYLQYQSQYGTYCWEDFREMNHGGLADYEFTGLKKPPMDISTMKREEIKKVVTEFRYESI